MARRGANGGTGKRDERERGRDVGVLLKLWPFLRPYRWRIAGAATALTVAAVTVLGLGQGLRGLVDQGFSEGDPDLLDHALIVLLAVILLLAGATYARFYLVSWVGERVVADLRKRVYDNVVRLSPGFFEVSRTGEILSRLTTDTSILQTVVGSSVSIALRNLLLLTGGSVMLIVTSARLTGLVFVLTPLVIVPIVVIGRRVRRWSRLSQDRIADLSAHSEETLSAVRTVQAFGHEARESGRFAQHAEAAFNAAVRRIRTRAALTALVIMLVFGAVGLVLWLGGRAVLDGGMSAGDLSAFVFYAVVVAGATGAVSEVVGDLQRAAGATERLLALIDIEPEIRAPADPAPLPAARGALRFEQVVFHYPTRVDAAALDGLSLSVEAGERLALVGPSGAGKTTVFQLLLRFYDPAAGRVEVDGVDIRRADPAEVRARFALVPQDPVIFAASVADNIRYGKPDADPAEVRAAAEAAAALDFIEALPQGFETNLGERGVLLSGGQRQRIAIARALLRDPAVLLLDEATSALDAESERLVQGALDRLMAGRTSITIAHRLATVQKADRIVVMDAGRIVAQGRHEQLMREEGLYARLAALQFAQGGEAMT